MNQQQTFKIQNNHILGKLNPIESLKQSIQYILSTERGKYLAAINDSDYGVEFENLFGLPIFLILPRLQFTITQALLTDDRIQDIQDFQVLNFENNKLHIQFRIITNLNNETLTWRELIQL